MPTRCALERPPSPDGIYGVQACEFVVCYDATNAIKLRNYLDDLTRWAKEAYVLCAEQTDNEDY